jgi:hypothetical protein
MKATDPNLLLEIQGDRIVITLQGTKFRVVYRKREHASWSWLIASDYDRDTAKILSQGQTSSPAPGGSPTTKHESLVGLEPASFPGRVK